MYFAIVLDRKTAGPMVIACAEGGTSIEDLAERYPDKIVRVPIDARAGMSDEQAATIVEGLGVGSHLEDAKGQIKALYQLFNENDCTMVEVNPLAEGADGKLIAADAKLNFDDNAAFRQKDLFAMRDTTQEDEREVRAAKVDLNYIGLDGEIGCMVNGAGLAMAILVNIFGGIMKCDVIAAGIVAAAKEVGMKVPLVVRLEGTNVEAGKAILAEAALNIISADDLDDAAVKAVHSLA